MPNLARLRSLCLAAGLLAIVVPNLGAQQFLINEVDADTPGTDTQEFIELISVDDEGNAVGDVPLDGLVVVLFNGSNDLSYSAYDLDGFATNANGFFVIGNATVPNVDIVVESNAIQNGADAVALYLGEADDFPNGTPVGAPPVGATLLDALVYGTDDSDDFGLLEALTPLGTQLNDSTTVSISRVPDGGDPFDSARYVAQEPSPGASNVPSAEFALVIDPAVLPEADGAIATATVSIDLAPAGDLEVMIANPDPSEVVMPESVVILAGEFSAEFIIVGVDDAWQDGDQVVTIGVSSPGVFPATADVTVQDDDTETLLLVNEIHAAVDFSGTNGDANRDGVGDSFDEFVEIVNVSGAPIDISGFTLRDRFLVRHTVNEGTLLGPDCALVIFGGKALEGSPAEYGGAQVQNANGAAEFGLSLNDSGGDVVSLRNLDGVEVAGHVYTTVFFSQGSLTRDPDLLGGFVQHESLNGGFPSFSPGFLNDAFTPFCELGALVLSASPQGIAEPDGTAQLTIARSSPFTAALEVALSTDDPSEISLPETAIIPAGEASVTVTVTAVDDSSADGTQSPAIIATAPGFVDGVIRIDVADDGDEPALVWINEIDPNQPGTDMGEFVELYDGGVGNTALDGLVLVFFNGGSSGDTAYLTVDLNGHSTNDQGFFVVGNAGVANVGLVISDNSVQNGPGDAVVLYRDVAANFPVDSFPTDANIVDGVVYNGADAGLAFALGITPEDSAPGDTEDDAIARVPNGGTLRDSSNFVAQAPTPGSSNADFQSGYAIWAVQNGVTGGPEADDEGDGIANLIEYALGLDPHFPDTTGLPQGSVVEAGDFEFVVAKGAAAAIDPALQWIVEVSTDLLTWSVDETEVVRDDLSELVVRYTGTSPTAVMRLRIEVRPPPGQ